MPTETTTAANDSDLDFNMFGSDDSDLDFNMFAAPVCKPSVYETRSRKTRSKVAIASERFAAMAK